MDEKTQALIGKLNVELPENAFKIADTLGRIGTQEIVDAMIGLLKHPQEENRIIAAITLGKIRENSSALQPLLEAIRDKENSAIAGELMMALEGFDVSDNYVDLFRLYLFGSYKVSVLAKELLDFAEFDVTARVLRKAEKHWHHYMHNAKQDASFEVKKAEVEAMLQDIRDFIGDDESISHDSR